MVFYVPKSMLDIEDVKINEIHTLSLKSLLSGWDAY